MYKDARKVCEDAIAVYGIQTQMMQTMEEMSELTQALSKYNRGLEHNVAEEICDVEIMLEQMKLHFKCHREVEKIKGKKLSRLYRKVEDRKWEMKKNDTCETVKGS